MHKILKGLPEASLIMAIVLLLTGFVFLMLEHLEVAGLIIIFFMILIALAYDIGKQDAKR